jgi:abequosyltransferase
LLALYGWFHRPYYSADGMAHTASQAHIWQVRCLSDWDLELIYSQSIGDFGMPHSRPLLTIAIPTYNRAPFLKELLIALEDQAIEHPEVEILVSDNASVDETAEIVANFIAKGMGIQYHRHSANVGADANFLRCLNVAQGKYLWICGDDDIILRGTLDKVVGHLQDQEFDLIYLTSYGFKKDYLEERQYDPLNRHFHTVTSARHFVKAVNIMLTFISGIIINKDQLGMVPHEDPSKFIGSTLIQLSWILPMLRGHRRSLILWDRPLAARQGNTGGYAIGKIFGTSLVDVVERCLPGRPDLVAIIVNYAVRRWLPSILYDIRLNNNQDLALETAKAELRKAYGSNFRYWIFTYPVLALPLPLAGVWAKASAIVGKIIYVVSMPGFWQKER